MTRENETDGGDVSRSKNSPRLEIDDVDARVPPLTSRESKKKAKKEKKELKTST